MFDKLIQIITNKYLLSGVRHGLTLVAGVLIASQFPGLETIGTILRDNINELAPAIVAGVSALVAFVGSFVSNRNKK